MKRLVKILLFLLLVAGSLIAIFWLKSETGSKKSFELSERIPESSFVGKVDITEMANVIMRAGKLPLDSFKSKWTHYFRNPLKIGVDPFVDPWLFGDTNRWCIAIQVKDQQSFTNYIDEMLVADFNLKKDSTADFSSYTGTSGFAIGYNTSGQTLLTFAQSKEIAAAELTNFFEHKEMETKKAYQTVNHRGVMTFHLKSRDNVPLFLSWLDTGTYRLMIDETKMVVEAVNGSYETVDTLTPFRFSMVGLPELSKTYLSKLPIQNILASLELDSGKIFHQPGYSASINGFYTKEEVYITYEYDDDFNEIPVPKSDYKSKLDWCISVLFEEEHDIDELVSKWEDAGLTTTADELKIKSTTINFARQDRFGSFYSKSTYQTEKPGFNFFLATDHLLESLNECAIEVPQKYIAPFEIMDKVSIQPNRIQIDIDPYAQPALVGLVRLAAWYTNLPDSTSKAQITF